ncbi:hypothetical protein K490DRAFT_58458 [Saccharata proteae CBS 121410]|uniref:Uncharacterized protein n=1 Tax=Saccharata proteae CBS 121410 TaxID=1314787 RepID=A0A9P4HTQ5_9PEZI|nr:hypothetical protein K490DRAFT_58458 [Saccharata proteae CBS 121410]
MPAVPAVPAVVPCPLVAILGPGPLVLPFDLINHRFNKPPRRPRREGRPTSARADAAPDGHASDRFSHRATPRYRTSTTFISIRLPLSTLIVRKNVVDKLSASRNHRLAFNLDKLRFSPPAHSSSFFVPAISPRADDQGAGKLHGSPTLAAITFCSQPSRPQAATRLLASDDSSAHHPHLPRPAWNLPVAQPNFDKKVDSRPVLPTIA